MPNHRIRQPRPATALLGLAFDADDGHKRITRGKNFLLCGGSEDTHGVMQQAVLQVNERLEEQGKELCDVSIQELRDLFHDVQE